MNSKLILLALLWVAFYALHSTMAHNSVKRVTEKLFGNKVRYYRIVFNLISIVFFVFNLAFQFSIEKKTFLNESLISKVAGGLIFLAGTVLLVVAFRTFNMKEFSGIEQLQKNIRTDKKPIPVLVKKGMYGYVRHPLYFAVITMLIGALIFLPNYSTMVFVVVSFVYLPIGVMLEEEKLIEEFGEQYLQYKKEVKMLIPYIF